MNGSIPVTSASARWQLRLAKDAVHGVHRFLTGAGESLGAAAAGNRARLVPQPLLHEEIASTGSGEAERLGRGAWASGRGVTGRCCRRSEKGGASGASG